MVYDNQDCLHDHHGKTVEQKYRHFFLFKSWICMFASEVLDFSVVNNTYRREPLLSIFFSVSICCISQLSPLYILCSSANNYWNKLEHGECSVCFLCKCHSGQVESLHCTLGCRSLLSHLDGSRCSWS